MTKFNVLITEKLAFTLEVEARDADHAREIAQQRIDDNETDDFESDESGYKGYEVEDVEEAN